MANNVDRREASPHSSLDDVPVPELVSRALKEARDLAGTEVDLAKEDVRSEARRAIRAVTGFTVGVVAAAVALSLLLMALVLAMGGAAWLPLALGSGFAVIAGASAAAGYASLPKELLQSTRHRLASDVDDLKRHPL